MTPIRELQPGEINSISLDKLRPLALADFAAAIQVRRLRPHLHGHACDILTEGLGI